VKAKSQIVIELKELLESELRAAVITEARKVYLEEKIRILDELLMLNLN
jgi:hypothetical protein